MKYSPQSSDGLTFQDVLAILEIVRQGARFDSFAMTAGGISVSMTARVRAVAPPAGRSEAVGHTTSIITAPALGMLHWDGEGARSGGVAGAVVSDQAAAGRIITLGRITDVLSRREGIVVEVLAGHGTFVEYGQPLLRIEHT